MKKLYLILAGMFLMFSFPEAYAAASVDSLVFTSSGEFIVPMGVSEVTIEVVGAGGNGWVNGGGGGGGGGLTPPEPATLATKFAMRIEPKPVV